ncbi:hypothetical protein [Streptomyces sp. PT12]|uniref:Pepco domain-containing protein n=1 Tax=Streptomyces sp. PT12 TaxID=1510197 RepID=UPI000DE41150|nr:hypothetical protein [Streptomyces sp. PT12]RBM19852.1 hypothetical protein DEH69_10225 [Streptomyces sp. PT12]
MAEILSVAVSLDDTDELPAAAGEMGLFRRAGDDGGDGDGTPRRAIRDIPVAVLRENLRRTVSALHEVLDGITVPEGGMPLREAQISFEVTATGGITLMGTSAQAAARGAITLTFGHGS